MNKLRIMSDLHLEFGQLTVPVLPNEDEQILVLAGDVHTGTDASGFIDEMLLRFKDVIYVLGNHEFYHGHMGEVRNWWGMAQGYRHNLHVLDNNTCEFHDVRFIGTTLWTATNNPDMNNMLNDFACIYLDGEVLTVAKTREMHLQAIDFLVAELAKPFDGDTVVVTHHAPVESCVRPHYVGDLINPCFHSRLDWLLRENDIDLWIHGHMHDTIHITCEGTEIYCNPRGYKGHQENRNFRTDFVFELGV